MKYLVLVLLIAVSDLVFAGTAPIQGCKAENLACAGKIDKIYLHPDGDVKVPPPLGFNPNEIACTLNGGMYFSIKRTHPHFKEMYSMLLTAHAASKDVYLRYLKDSPECEIWYTVIY